jgi:hypothetical protein
MDAEVRHVKVVAEIFVLSEHFRAIQFRHWVNRTVA